MVLVSSLFEYLAEELFIITELDWWQNIFIKQSYVVKQNYSLGLFQLMSNLTKLNQKLKHGLDCQSDWRSYLEE